ncbi:YhjD/YihY/BrkB family envelope integrity protein [Rhodococcus sp. HNM0569]|uniref:YihY/virulence factor BrkB family protein n=1 Tax=Rhodococcus sp. HNM0569 TaxID=2716340 RepID=UPI00146D628B|nr:YhjD/YihY/BrkB family envelope integrity protein [Rhodococcus sp. HNM0569]NLU81385.1 YihY/virulence factor BrkB family protein [Rhodococcus sp. HNM0569]
MTESAARHAGRDERNGDAPARRHPIRRTVRFVVRTAEKSWDDSIFGRSATAAFWQTLSLPPLLLGLLGMLGWFGPQTVDLIEEKIISFSRTVFSENVVESIIGPTVADMLARGRAEVVSLSFLLSLWAGSSAISTFVDSIVAAHGQADERHPVWQRVFALLLYVVFLVLAVFTLPLVALGPTLIGRMLPDSWHDLGSRLVDTLYYPAVFLLLIVGLTTLYKVALPRSLPWHRLLGGALLAGAFFVAASTVLRTYLTWLTGTGYTYGALAAPIAFLLFTFFLGFAVVLGAEFNATVQEFWPARATRIEQVRDWLAAQTSANPTGPMTAITKRFATTPMRIGPLRTTSTEPDADGPDRMDLDARPPDAAPSHDDASPEGR